MSATVVTAGHCTHAAGMLWLAVTVVASNNYAVSQTAKNKERNTHIPGGAKKRPEHSHSL